MTESDYQQIIGDLLASFALGFKEAALLAFFIIAANIITSRF